MSMEEKAEEAAQECDRKISDEAGKSTEQYVDGLEVAIGFLEVNLNAARDDLKRAAKDA